MSQIECICENKDHDNCSNPNCSCSKHPNTVKVNLDNESPSDISDSKVSG